MMDSADTLLASLQIGDNVPDTEGFDEIFRHIGSPDSHFEVHYTWKNGVCSRSVQIGPADDCFVTSEGSLRCVLDDPDYPYVMYLPQGYDPADGKKWPLVFFFHGIGERGDDPHALLKMALPEYLHKGGALDAIMVAPQCPAESHWVENPAELEKLSRFIPRMLASYPVDEDRVYITGLSMGGRCCWMLALAMPETFAAAAIICGRTIDYDLHRITRMPIWMFHGIHDEITPFFHINRVIPSLSEYGHLYYKLTVYPRLGHAIWQETYAKRELYHWLLAQSRSNNAAEI